MWRVCCVLRMKDGSQKTCSFIGGMVQAKGKYILWLFKGKIKWNFQICCQVFWIKGLSDAKVPKLVKGCLLRSAYAVHAPGFRWATWKNLTKNVQKKNHEFFSENKFPRQKIIHAPGFRWTILNLQMLVLSCLAPPECTTTVKIYSLFCSVSFQDTIWPFTRQSWAACGTSSKLYMTVFSISFNIVKIKNNKKVERLRDYLTSLHIATDTEELFILVLRGVDDAIQKVFFFFFSFPFSLFFLLSPSLCSEE